MIDLRQSPQWAEYMKGLGWRVEKVGGCQIFIKQFPFGLGSIIKILRPSLPIPFEQTDKIAKKYNAWFVKLEPNVPISHFLFPISHFQKYGFLPSSWPLSPSKTIRIDLKKSEKKLWTDLKKETRNIIRRAIKNGVAVNQSKEVEYFCELWVKSMRRKGSLLATGGEVRKMWKAFHENAHFLLAHQLTNKTQPLAGALIITYGKAASYIFAASTGQGNKFGAPSLIVWEAMLLAKNLGCEIFDLEGIYDSRYQRATKSWKGFSMFKKGFGRKEISYIGSFIKYYNSFLKAFPF